MASSVIAHAVPHESDDDLGHVSDVAALASCHNCISKSHPDNSVKTGKAGECGSMHCSFHHIVLRQIDTTELIVFPGKYPKFSENPVLGFFAETLKKPPRTIS